MLYVVLASNQIALYHVIIKSVLPRQSSRELLPSKLVASSAVETPVPIPNTAVKHCYVDDSRFQLGPAKVDRRQFIVEEFFYSFCETSSLDFFKYRRYFYPTQGQTTQRKRENEANNL